MRDRAAWGSGPGRWSILSWPQPRCSRSGPAALSLAFAPLALIGFSLTAGLTFRYLSTLYRSQLFLHLSLVGIAAGLATVAGIARLSDRSNEGWDRTVPGRARVAVPAPLVVCAGASAPLVFSGLQVLTYKEVTSPAEFAATGYAATELPDGWTTDDHLARVSGYFRGPDVVGLPGRPIPGGKGPSTGPVRRWVLEGGSPPDCSVLAQQSWTTTGAQFHPRRPVRVDSAAFERWVGSRNLVYAVGRRDPLAVVAPRANATRGC